MASGLAALLDDIAVIAKAAAASVDDITAAAGKATAKAAGVVVDDAAVAPRFVDGVTPKRELPIVMKIMAGSLANKLLLILPAAILLSQFAPWILTPLLMLGGLYLCYEGAEKLWELVTGAKHETAAVAEGPDAEKKIVRGAIKTDFILSAEIMVISLNEVASQPFWIRLGTLVVVAIAVTLGVYGVVALIVKMDDFGLHLSRRKTSGARSLGVALVKGMPVLLNIISIVGIFAMLWVGGHILISGADTLGWHAPHELVHTLSHLVHIAPLSWLIETLCSLLFGIIAGGIIVAVHHAIVRARGGSAHH